MRTMMHDGPLIRLIGSRDGRALWRLEETWWVAAHALDPWLCGHPLLIPAGIKTDLASIPRWALSAIGDVGQEAGLCHDYLYQAHGLFQNADELPLPRSVADDVLHELMGVYGPTDWRRAAMYAAVRIGGGRAWRAHEERLLALNPVVVMETAFA